MNISFKETKAYHNITKFINQIVEQAKEKDQSVNFHYMNILDQIAKLIERTPLSDEKGRFANLNAKLVFTKLSQENEYLRNSWGNSVRLDYGTGHELNYLCYIYQEYTNGCIHLNEVYSLFVEYFKVSRQFIKKFNLEPAGSKGGWTLDDYQLLPFLIGSARSIFRTEEWFTEYVNNCRSIFISSLLNRNWKDVVVDMVKMYDREVFSRDVVMKGFIFSKELPVE